MGGKQGDQFQPHEVRVAMTPQVLPRHVTAKGGTATFSEQTLPNALLEEHDLKANRWGVLHVISGQVFFVDLEAGTERHLVAPTTHVIAPRAKHRLRLDGPLQCRVNFFSDDAADLEGSSD